MSATRIRPHEAMEEMKERALLVCAYDDEEKCREMLLEGAITLADLKALEPSLDRDPEIIFYCA